MNDVMNRNVMDQITEISNPDNRNLVFTDTGRERLDQIIEFLRALPEDGEHTAAIRQEFLDRLVYLDGFRGDDCYVQLSYDFANLSFNLAWYIREEGEDDKFWFNGGLIWHGGPNDPLTVTLVSQWWGIHT